MRRNTIFKGDGVRHNRSGAIVGTNDSWLPSGARSLLLSWPTAELTTLAGCNTSIQATDRSDFATDTDCRLRSDRHAGTLWATGFRPLGSSRYVPVRNVVGQPFGMLSPRSHRPVHVESHGDLARLARSHHGWFFRRIHDIFELRMGNGKDVGGRRIGSGHNVRRRQRRHWVASLGCRHSHGEPVLGARYDPRKI
jgi:hypothetical protein